VRFQLFIEGLSCPHSLALKSLTKEGERRKEKKRGGGGRGVTGTLTL